MQNYKKVFLILFGIISFNVNANSIISKEYYIPYNNQKIHLKEKKLASSKSSKIIVLINPLSIPSLVAFDIPKYSLMDALALHGYDVWGIDFIGEGKSSYPKVMETNPAPLGVYPLQAKEAVKELRQGVDFIYNSTGQDSVSILGWSWGSVVGAMYAIIYPKEVDRLILYGAMYSSHLPKVVEPMFIKPFADESKGFSDSLPAYQNIPWSAINMHWNMMIDTNDSIVTKDAVSSVANAYINSDPQPVIPHSLRRPMGPMKDLYNIWNDHPIYDISKLKSPTLVIYGDQDLFADHELYNKLTNVTIKQQIVLKEATHWLIYEKTREEFINDITRFVDNHE